MKDSLTNKPSSPPANDLKSPSSLYKRPWSPEEPKSENHIIPSPSRDVSHEQTATQCLDPAGAGVVRAELVVVQNESSESEENDEEFLEDAMSEVKLQRELKSESPKEDLNSLKVSSPQNHTEDKQLEKDVCVSLELKKEEPNQEEDDEEEEEEEVIQKRNSCHKDDDEESEEEDPDECGKSSPVFYSFENAAFLDDKEGESVQDQQDEVEEDEDEDEVYEEYDDAPGLSEDEERSPRRKIRFSTEPIRVSNSKSG